LLERVLELLRRLLAHAFEALELLYLQRIEISRRLHKTGFNELVDEFRTQSLDIHCPSRREVPQRLLSLRCTGEPADATCDRVPFESLPLRSADRATGRRLHYPCIRRTLFPNNRNGLRNDIARASYDDVVPLADVLPA